MISSIVFDEDEVDALQGNLKNIKKGIFADKKEEEEGQEDENEFLGADLATKNIKRELNNDFRKRGRKRRDVLEYEKLLNKDKIIEKLEESRNLFKNFYNLKDEKNVEQILFIEKKKDKKNEGLLTFVKNEENSTIFSFENYIQFVTVKKQSNEVYEKIFEYIFQNNLNIPFSILVINYFNLFVSLETCEKKINAYLDKNRLQEFFLEIKENNSSLSNIFSLKNVLNKESELKKFLLVFYYYFDFLKGVL